MAETRGVTKAPGAAQMFGNAGIEYMERYPETKPIHMAKIASKNHTHSLLNPYSQVRLDANKRDHSSNLTHCESNFSSKQFQDGHSVEKVMSSKQIFGPLTLLQCCPTSDGAGACILASEDFVRKHNLAPQAIEICAQVMATDSVKPVATRSAMENAGADMSRRAASEAYKIAGVTVNDIGVCELHDCFSSVSSAVLSFDPFTDTFLCFFAGPMN